MEQQMGRKRRLTSNDRDDERSRDMKQQYDDETAKLKDELEKEKEFRVAFEDKVTGLEEEIDELNAQLEERDEAWREEYHQKRTQERLEAANLLSATESEARRRKEEVNSLQRQIADLKRNVSTSTRVSVQISDTTFKQEMGILQHEVQNWVVNNFRRVRCEASAGELCDRLGKVTEPRQLDQLRPIYKGFDPAAKLPIYQATVASHMMEVFEDPFLFGLRGQRDWAKRIRQAGDSLPAALEPVVYNRWRASTFDALRQSPSVKEMIESSTTGIAEMICITLEAMTEVEDSGARLTSLKSIIKRAISLAHLIRVQQAQYEFILPSPGQPFDATAMDEIADESDAAVERIVKCATFPSITKVGDEDGDHLDHRTLIVKAKVLCNDSKPS